MKKLLLLLFPAVLNAQEVAFQYEFGYGSFQLKDIKAIHNRVQRTMSRYGARTVEYFPNHYIHSGAFGFILGQHHFGASGVFLTTGSRAHVSDYSGEYKTDMVLRGIRWGLFYRYYIPNKQQWLNVYVQAAPGFMFSRLRMSEQLFLDTRKILDESLYFRSRGMYIEPSIGIRFKPLHWLHLSLGCGYEINAWGKMKQTNTHSTRTTYRGDDKIRWNGFRLYAGLILTVPGHVFRENGVNYK